ncbi:hypothetical protein YC2023_002184 [Brassica napus]
MSCSLDHIDHRNILLFGLATRIIRFGGKGVATVNSTIGIQFVLGMIIFNVRIFGKEVKNTFSHVRYFSPSPEKDSHPAIVLPRLLRR